MTRHAHHVIAWFAILLIAGCGRTSDEEPIPGDSVLTNFSISVSLFDISSPVTRASGNYTAAANDREKMRTLRIIVVRPNGKVEHNRFLDFKAAVELYQNENFRVTANETKRIYLIANEGLTTVKNGLSEDAVSPRLPDFDFNAITEGSLFPAEDVAALTIGLTGGSEELDGPLPMSECHRVWVPAENSSCNLFITRAAVKFSVLITNESGRALTLAGLAIDKMLRQEYYLPKNAQYEIREGNVREITVYDVPSTGDNNGYYTFKRTYGNGVTLMAGEEKNLDPIYLLEGKYSDHTAGTGENGVPLNYSINISLAEVGGEPQKKEYLTNLPQLPRNTHVVVHAIIRGNSEISWTVDVVPYGQAILEPIFGL